MKRHHLGIGLIVIGIGAGLFVGVWLCLIGGIVQVINGLQDPEGINALTIAVGIGRIIFTGLAGWLSALIFVTPGMSLLK